MWLFDERIALLRKTHCFLVKIAAHENPEVSGRRDGKVSADPNPLQHPILMTSSTDVEVKYHNQNKHFVEKMPTRNLAPKLKSKARHAIIKGDKTGDVVIHLKTDGPDARVHLEGTPMKEGFRIVKEHICLIEKVT